MKTSELTADSLIAWAEETIQVRIRGLSTLVADEREAIHNDHWNGQRLGRNEVRQQTIQFLEELKNNLRLGVRVIAGELPELGDRPWSERDADHDNNERTPVVGYL